MEGYGVDVVLRFACAKVRSPIYGHLQLARIVSFNFLAADFA